MPEMSLGREFPPRPTSQSGMVSDETQAPCLHSVPGVMGGLHTIHLRSKALGSKSILWKLPIEEAVFTWEVFGSLIQTWDQVTETCHHLDPCVHQVHHQGRHHHHHGGPHPGAVTLLLISHTV